LPAGLQIDDAEPSHAKTNVRAKENAVIVRTAMNHRIAHAVDVLSDDRAAVEAHNASNSAHEVLVVLGTVSRATEYRCRMAAHDGR